MNRRTVFNFIMWFGYTDSYIMLPSKRGFCLLYSFPCVRSFPAS